LRHEVYVRRLVEFLSTHDRFSVDSLILYIYGSPITSFKSRRRLGISQKTAFILKRLERKGFIRPEGVLWAVLKIPSPEDLTPKGECYPAMQSRT